MLTLRFDVPNPPARLQRGVTTLTITLLLLAIVTVMVLFSTSVGFFEQRTTRNESRGRLAEQAAEYALNLSGEYIKANRDRLIENEPTKSGWLATTGTTRRWVLCSEVGVAATDFPAAHPCLAERGDTRRGELYFYTQNGNKNGTLTLPYSALMPAGTTGPLLEATGVGGVAAFPTTTTVTALMCRMDTSLTVPACKASPVAGDRIAVTLVSTAQLTSEDGTTATVKETWGTFSDFTPQSAVPLVASGIVTGSGNVTVVAAPNGGGNGIATSMWAPSDIDIGSNKGSCGTGGLASVSTCHLEGYLASNGVSRENLKDASGCAATNKCGCPALNTVNPNSPEDANALSGHGGTYREERSDILDSDGSCGSPSITFFPRHASAAPRDVATDVTDDSLLEWIFNVDYVVAPVLGATGAALSNSGSNAVLMNCPNSLGNSNCAVYAVVDQFGATPLADCSSLDTNSSGIFYITGDCTLGDVGSKNSSVVVVVDGSIRVGGVVFGLVFARSDNNNNSQAITGNGKIFGSLVVEGNVAVGGNLDIVADETSASGKTTKLPRSAKFGRLPGSWLDARSGF